MYTGKLISELVATVEGAEQRVEQQRMTEELHAIFAMQIPVEERDRILMGAA